MTTEPANVRLTSFAPQFLVDDIQRSIDFYRDHLDFVFGKSWKGFYAIGCRDGLEIHLKCAPKNQSERAHRRANKHLDAYANVVGVGQLYQKLLSAGVKITKPLAQTEWGTHDFYIEDPDGYILCFGEAATL